jgi:hypothetical protein
MTQLKDLVAYVDVVAGVQEGRRDGACHPAPDGPGQELTLAAASIIGQTECLVPAYREVGMLRRVLLVVVVNVCTSLLTSCQGGCWLHAGAVSMEPAADCLTLFVGDSPTDTKVCGVPSLGGVNNCTDSLTLRRSPRVAMLSS